LLGEHSIWGKHCLYERALQSPLMIRSPGLTAPGQISSAIVETVDLFPTLVDLCGLPPPSNLDGRSLRRQLNDPATLSDKPAHGFWTGEQRTVRNQRWRLIVSKETETPRVELFDYETDPLETSNHAQAQPEVVQELLSQLKPIPTS
jgi:iduronate 2-sulfatase